MTCKVCYQRLTTGKLQAEEQEYDFAEKWASIPTHTVVTQRKDPLSIPGPVASSSYPVIYVPTVNLEMNTQSVIFLGKYMGLQNRKNAPFKHCEY